jgi:hypothetical protein
MVVFDTVTGESIVSDEILVIFKDSLSEPQINAKVSGWNAKVVGSLKWMNDYQLQVSGLSLDQLHALIAQVRADPDVEAASFNALKGSSQTEPVSYSVHPAEGMDPEYKDWNESNPSGHTWGLDAIYAPKAWAVLPAVQEAPIIGVIDGGFFTGHEDLSFDEVESYDHNSEPPDLDSPNSKDRDAAWVNFTHGTHVSGIIGATANNPKGITGVTWNNGKLKAWRHDGTTYNIKYGVLWLANRGATVINASIQGSKYTYENRPSADLDAANTWLESEKKYWTAFTNNLIKRFDVLLVVAAGNYSFDAKWSGLWASITDPGARSHILIVGALDSQRDWWGNYKRALHWLASNGNVDIGAPGSNCCSQIDIFAPGLGIFSTSVTREKTPSYKLLSGTSQAAPYVTGVAALVRAANPSLSAVQVRQIIIATMDRSFSEVVNKEKYTYYILNAYEAVKKALATLGMSSRPNMALALGKIQNPSDLDVNSGVGGADIVLYSGSPRVEAARVQSQSDGSFEFAAPPGSYTLEVSKPGFFTTSYPLVLQDGANFLHFGAPNAVLLYRACAVDGDIINAVTKQGVPGLVITFRPNVTVGDPVTATTTTDTNGHYNIQLKPGFYTAFTDGTSYSSISFALFALSSEGTHVPNQSVTPIQLPTLPKPTITSPSASCVTVAGSTNASLAWTVPSTTDIDHFTVDVVQTDSCDGESLGSLQGFPKDVAAGPNGSEALSGLSPNTWYKYSVTSTASAGYQSSNTVGSFKTGAVTPTCTGPASQPCGNCDTGTQTHTCVNGNWGSWSACTGGGVCAPDTTQPCTNGTQTCTALCAWGICVPPPDCTSGTTESAPCVKCGTKSRTCTNGAWGAFSACTGQGACDSGSTQSCTGGGTQTCTAQCAWGICVPPPECTSGATESAPCEKCGRKSRTCTNGAWGAFGACSQQGACTPGDTQSCNGDGTQLCSDACQWNSCNQPPGAPTMNMASTAVAGDSVSVSVISGVDPEGTQVKVQCSSFGSNHDSTPYDSGFVGAGASLAPTFVWSMAGTKTVYCTTYDSTGKPSSVASADIVISSAGCLGFASQGCGNCGTWTRTCNAGQWSDWSDCNDQGVCAPGATQACGNQTQTCGQTCQWSLCNLPPTAPSISMASTATLGLPVTVTVTVGTDPEAAQVKVQCGSVGSDHDAQPYDSGLGVGGREVTPTFTWSSTGSTKVYCTSYDATGAPSDVASSTITVLAQSGGPLPKPTITSPSTSCAMVTGTTTTDLAWTVTSTTGIAHFSINLVHTDSCSGSSTGSIADFPKDVPTATSANLTLTGLTPDTWYKYSVESTSSTGYQANNTVGYFRTATSSEGSVCSWAQWPMPEPASAGLPNPANYTVNVDGTVRDNVTGLTWQRDVPASTYTWDQAKTYCASLSLAGTGWRLPSRIELVSLVDFTRYNPAIDTTAFPNTPSVWFWTSSAVAGSSGGAWYVAFYNGYTYGTGVGSYSRVRCVR